MKNMIRNWIIKLPLIRGIIKRLNNIEASQIQSELLIENLKAELNQTNKELSQVKNELKYIKNDIEYRYNKLLPTSEYENELKNWYKSKTNKVLDLDNPKTFNEKIQWLKLYDKSPLKTQLSDKYLVRDWVKQKIGEQYLIPMIGVWDDFDEIDFDIFPQQFVLKANHGSGWNIIVKDKENFNKGKAKKEFDRWLTQNYAFYSGFELQYKDIKPKIVAEHYIGTGEDLLDYKYVCFNGEVKYVWVDSERFKSHKRDIFDSRWKLVPMTFKYPNSTTPSDRPKILEDMINIAKKLSQSFIHVRVDLYNVNEKIYFGEMTFSSESGIGQIIPEKYDYIWGDMINLSNK